MVLFCFDSYFHLTSILLSYEIVDFCSEKSSNQIGIEKQGVKSVNILNILYFSGAFSVIQTRVVSDQLVKNRTQPLKFFQCQGFIVCFRSLPIDRKMHLKIALVAKQQPASHPFFSFSSRSKICPTCPLTNEYKQTINASNRPSNTI